MQEYLAKIRKHDKKQQLVKDHLVEVAELSMKFAKKIGLPLCGQVVGLAHDLGKYSSKFQIYIKVMNGLSEEGLPRKEETYHSTAGGQFITQKLESIATSIKLPKKRVILWLSQILSTCVICHHTGLCDYISTTKESPYLRRIKRPINESNYHDVLANGDKEILQKIESLLEDAIGEYNYLLEKLFKSKDENDRDGIIIYFYTGLLVRFLFSCLLDADRLSSANFEHTKLKLIRNYDKQLDWLFFVKKIEGYLDRINSANKISKVGEIRKEVSEYCLNAAKEKNGIFTLCVPTGGGKTLSSLRFAVQHAFHAQSKGVQVDRIIYIIPYTSIIEQNVQVAREVFGEEWVLEHHSNLNFSHCEDAETDQNYWKNQIYSENWDLPIVFTTSVQFLNSLFDGSNNSARRMHQLANAIIIFDEIQTLPIKMIHLFNNSINFLTKFCNSSIVLCTATQPALHIAPKMYGSLNSNELKNIINDSTSLFKNLRRVQIENYCRNEGWSIDEITNLVKEKLNECNDILIVTNTKKSANSLYNLLSKLTNIPTFHLSTNMCAAHRKQIIDLIKDKLNQEQPLICVSTQLIEAGVDIDFECVIRYLAGLDSIAQAAGRCNRNGKNQSLSPVVILNPKEENLDYLPDIKKGIDATKTILNEYNSKPQEFDYDLLSPKAIDKYYKYYYSDDRYVEMKYQVNLEMSTTLLDLLSTNTHMKADGEGVELIQKQAFQTAGESFKVIDAPTVGIIVPYDKESRNIISELCALSIECLAQKSKLLRKTQKYMVNVFPSDFFKLIDKGCIYEIQEGSNIYYLDERYYNQNYGITFEESNSMDFLNI